jgi:hypothetical protein
MKAAAAFSALLMGATMAVPALATTRKTAPQAQTQGECRYSHQNPLHDYGISIGPAQHFVVQGISCTDAYISAEWWQDSNLDRPETRSSDAYSYTVTSAHYYYRWKCTEHIVHNNWHYSCHAGAVSFIYFWLPIEVDHGCGQFPISPGTDAYAVRITRNASCAIAEQWIVSFPEHEVLQLSSSHGHNGHLYRFHMPEEHNIELYGSGPLVECEYEPQAEPEWDCRAGLSGYEWSTKPSS